MSLLLLTLLMSMFLLILWLKRRKALPLPPGPRGIYPAQFRLAPSELNFTLGLPIVGNILDFQGDTFYVTARDWAKEYCAITLCSKCRARSLMYLKLATLSP